MVCSKSRFFINMCLNQSAGTRPTRDISSLVRTTLHIIPFISHIIHRECHRTNSMGATSCWLGNSSTSIRLSAPTSAHKTTTIRCRSDPSILWRSRHTLHSSSIWTDPSLPTIHPRSRRCRRTVRCSTRASYSTASTLLWRTGVHQCTPTTWLPPTASGEPTSGPVWSNEYGTERSAFVYYKPPHCSARTT